MIDLTMEEFLLWVIGVPMIGIAVVTLLRGMGMRARRRSLRQEIIRCRICGHLYKDKTRDKFCPCPECESLNERGRSRRLS